MFLAPLQAFPSPTAAKAKANQSSLMRPESGQMVQGQVLCTGHGKSAATKVDPREFQGGRTG